MGYNLISVCHKHKVQLFHYRNEENKTILPFYIEHKECARENINNVIILLDNNDTDQLIDKYKNITKKNTCYDILVKYKIIDPNLQIEKYKMKKNKQFITGVFIRKQSDEPTQLSDSNIIFTLKKEPKNVYDNYKLLLLILKYFSSKITRIDKSLIDELINLLKVNKQQIKQK